MFLGSEAMDLTVVGLLAAAIGFVGRQFGRAWLVTLAEAILSRKEETKPVTLRGKPVALPWFVALLVSLIPTLLPLIEQAIDALAKRLGREPTDKEIKEVALDVAKGAAK